MNEVETAAAEQQEQQAKANTKHIHTEGHTDTHRQTHTLTHTQGQSSSVERAERDKWLKTSAAAATTLLSRLSVSLGQVSGAGGGLRFCGSSSDVDFFRQRR